MNFKKIALASAIATCVVAPSLAMAAGNAVFERGVLVPWVVHNGSQGQSTVVGFMTNNNTVDSNCFVQEPDGKKRTKVYWTFFDADSTPKADDTFKMTPKDMYSWNWAAQGRGLTGINGYAVFAADNDGTYDASTDTGTGSNAQAGVRGCLAANAFYLDVPNGDVAFVPTVPMNISDFVPNANIDNMDANTVQSLQYGNSGAFLDGWTLANTQAASPFIYARHFVDGKVGGNDTRIVLWTTGNVQNIPVLNPIGGLVHVNMYDNEQAPQSGNIELTRSELNIINPEDLAQVNGFNLSKAPDGFIAIPSNGVVNGVTNGWYSFSYVSSADFSAVQTLINPATRSE